MLAYAIGLLVIISLAFYRLFLHRRLKRRRLLRKPFPRDWEQTLQARMALYRRLPESLRARLRDDIRILLDEVAFYGCAGMTLTGPVKVLTAAHAALLVSGLNVNWFHNLKTVLIYPGAYRARQAIDDGLVYSEAADDRLGESWEEGRVILAWDTLEQEAADPGSRSNVALHEFCHQLDQLDGEADGAPPLGSTEQAQRWQRVFEAAWKRLQHSNGDSVIDDYGAEEPAEFFAVATEAFFLCPKRLSQDEPELYQCLENFYRVSPASWAPASET